MDLTDPSPIMYRAHQRVVQTVSYALVLNAAFGPDGRHLDTDPQAQVKIKTSVTVALYLNRKRSSDTEGGSMARIRSATLWRRSAPQKTWPERERAERAEVNAGDKPWVIGPKKIAR